MTRARQSGGPAPLATGAGSIHQLANWLEPLDWPALFPAAQPVEIDIGSGKGGYLLWAAQAKSTTNFLGVERQLVRLRKVDAKIQRLGLQNVRQLRVEASYLVGKLLAPHSVAAFHIYFPDPWPKRRHHPRRLVQPAFVAELHRALRPGGAVHVATDHLDYFAHIQKVMRASGQFRETPADALPMEARTEFEKIFLAQGKVIGRAKFCRE